MPHQKRLRPAFLPAASASGLNFTKPRAPRPRNLPIAAGSAASGHPPLRPKTRALPPPRVRHPRGHTAEKSPRDLHLAAFLAAAHRPNQGPRNPPGRGWDIPRRRTPDEPSPKTTAILTIGYMQYDPPPSTSRPTPVLAASSTDTPVSTDRPRRIPPRRTATTTSK